MKINATSKDKKTDLRDGCGKLVITASHPNEKLEKLEAELLSRIYQEISRGQTGSLLFHLREVQDNGKEIKYFKPRKKRVESKK